MPLLLVLVVWSVLFLPNLRTSPSWYGDETLALKAGLDLTHGIAAHRAIWNTFWHPYAPYQPGYEYLIGWAARLFGSDILGGRLVNALLALGIALLITFYGRRIFGILPALFSALLFLTYEQTVIHFRWIFTHNLIAFGFVLSVLSLARPAGRRNDSLAGLGLGISSAALPLFIYGLPPAWLIRLKRPRSWFWLFLPAGIIVGLSLALGWFMHLPEQFLWQDLAATARFYAKSSGESSATVSSVSLNIYRFFTQDGWHTAGFVMLLVCLCRRFYAIGLSGLMIAFLLVQNRQNLHVFYYQAVIFLPLMIMAFAVTEWRIVVTLRRRGVKTRLLRTLQFALLALPISQFVRLAPQTLSGTLKPRIQHWATQSTSEVEQAARWLNENTSEEDLVICNVNIAWLLKAKTADLQQATSWAGFPTWPFDTPLPRAQFRYDANIAAARFLVIGDIDRRWTLAQQNVDKMVGAIADQEWPVVWQGPNYLIARNPKFPIIEPANPQSSN